MTVRTQERSPIAGVGAASDVDAGPKRHSVQRKMAVVARLLWGEPLDVVARKANVSFGQANRMAGPSARQMSGHRSFAVLRARSRGHEPVLSEP
jgi:hypothetical protein